jgi:Ca-activated chloride channel family protein
MTDLSFLWAPMLLFLLAIPFGVAAFVARDRRRARAVATLGFGASAAAGGPSGAAAQPPAKRSTHRGRFAGLLMLTGITVMTVALARPQGVVGIPRFEGTLILAFDVSGSMVATDLPPNRMEAAKAVARDLVERQPDTIRIGVVAFSDSGFSIQVPTTDPLQVGAAIDRLEPERGTSIARGIIASLTLLADEEQETDYYSEHSAPPTPVPAGRFESAVMLLLTDGENTQDPDPLLAAQVAAERGVRIYTVGIGTAEGTTIEVEGMRIHSALDEPMLERISALSGGAYVTADRPDDVRRIYDAIDTNLVVRPESMELTSILALAGLACLLAGGVISLIRLGRVP